MYNVHRCAALRGSLLSDLRASRCAHSQAGSPSPKDRQRRTPEGVHRSNFQRQPQKFHKQPSPRVDFDSVETLAERLIGTSDQREVSGWKHTKSLRGDEMRLASTIKVKQDLPRFSTEKQAMEAVDPIDRFESLADYEVVPAVKATPGTFVEIRRCVFFGWCLVCLLSFTQEFCCHNWHHIDQLDNSSSRSDCIADGQRRNVAPSTR